MTDETPQIRLATGNTAKLLDDARSANLGVDESGREGVVTLGTTQDPDRVNIAYDDNGELDSATRYNANGAVVGTYGSVKALRSALGLD